MCRFLINDDMTEGIYLEAQRSLVFVPIILIPMSASESSVLNSRECHSQSEVLETSCQCLTGEDSIEVSEGL